MRLIDADALKEEIEKNMENGFPANEYLSLYAISCIAHAPTVCDIEQIRAEIDGLLNDNDSSLYEHGVLDALDIIDKHISRKE